MLDVDVEYTQSPSWDSRMHERFRWLRQHDPVRWSEKDQCWLISRYEDVVQVSKNQELFTSADGVRAGNAVKIGLIDEGQPRHGQLRGLINRGFTPRMVGRLSQTFRSLTTRAIDAVAQRQSCDFVESISVPLPLWMIAAMMGIREEDYGRFHAWSDAMISADGNHHDPVIMARAGAAYMEYATYLTGIIESRRAEPREDLISILAGAKDEGLLTEYDESQSQAFGRLDESQRDAGLENDELIKILVILLVAGNETTRNAISGGMQLLIENPGERQKLLEDPGLLKSGVEEMVRLVSPVHSFARRVTADTELRGRKLSRGDWVLLLYPSANRDETVFEEPDTFRVERNPNHVGFGIGPHFCLGANLARMELAVVFGELLRRLPDMEYAEGGPVFQPSALVRSCVEMKVRYTPERAAA